MPNAKRNLEEEQSLLLENESGIRRSGNPLFETAIIKGVANHMSKWPSHLFAAFLAATLVFAAFILFAMVTALFCAPTVYRCRRWKNGEFTEVPNIYFIKHANRSWTAKDLCYVESTARNYPQINVYLINLMPESPLEINSLRIETEKLEIMKNREVIELLWEKANNSLEKVADASSSLAPEAKTRKELAAYYANVRNVDVTVEHFFQGSMLVHVCHELDVKTLEVAARAYVLWNTPGVALNPYDSRYLEALQTYLCKRGCKTVSEAAINPEGSIQASGVACQAFIGCLIHEIAVHGLKQNWKIVEKAQQSFCRSSNVCPGLKMVNTSSVEREPSCPTVYSSGAEATKIFSKESRKLRKLKIE